MNATTFCAGAGQEDVRNVQVSEDIVTVRCPPWSLREAAVEDTRRWIRMPRCSTWPTRKCWPVDRWLLSANSVSTPDTQYQRDWNLGDVVNVTF